MKVSLFCLGSTAGAVIVGSAGLALESWHKPKAAAVMLYSLDMSMIGISITAPS
jgi:hypothetical protein